MRKLLLILTLIPALARADYVTDGCPTLFGAKISKSAIPTGANTANYLTAPEINKMGDSIKSVCQKLSENTSKLSNLEARVNTLEGNGGVNPPPSQAAAPTASPAPGTYTSAQSVSFAGCSGGTVYYTTDGTTPTTSSTAYTSPINVNTTTTFKAMCHRAGSLDSITATFTYTIGGVIPSADLVPFSLGYYATGFPGCGYSGCPISGIYWAAYTHVVNFGNSGNNPSMTSVPSNSSTFVSTAHTNGAKAILGTGSAGATYPTSNLSTWASNLVSMANAAGYDGIDVDWETGGANYSSANVKNVVTALRTAANATSLPNFIITVATASDVNIVNTWSPPMDQQYTLITDMYGYNSTPSTVTGTRVPRWSGANVPFSKLGMGFGISNGDSSGGANGDLVAGDCVAKASTVQGTGMGFMTWGMQTSAESRACEQALAPYVPAHGPWSPGGTGGGTGGGGATNLAIIGSGTAHSYDNTLSQAASVSGVTAGDTIIVEAYADDANATQSSAPSATLTSPGLTGITQINSVSSGNNMRGHAWKATASSSGTITVTYNTGMSAASLVAKKVAVYALQGVQGVGVVTSAVLPTGTVFATTISPQATGSLLLVSGQDDKGVTATANAATVFDFNTKAGASWFFGRGTSASTAATSQTLGGTAATTGNYTAIIMGIEIIGSSGTGGGGGSGGTGGGVASSYTPTRWVDCSAGVNGNGLSGAVATSAGGTGAWNSLASIPSSLAAGTVVALKAGTTCISSGTKDINGQGTSGSPVVLVGDGTASGYGTGADAIIDNRNSGGNVLRIPSTASYTIIDGVRVRNTVSGESTIGGLDKAASATVSTIGGITLGTQNSTAGGHNIVQNCEIENVGYGMWIWNDDNLVRKNYIHDLRMIVSTNGGSEDYGAVGIQVYANNTRITGNTFRRTRSIGYDNGQDGGVIELFNNGSVSGQTINNTTIDHNWMENTFGVIEVTGASTNGWVLHNVIIDSVANVIGFHANAGGSGFRLENNSVKVTNTVTPLAFGQAVWCSGTTTNPGLVVKNNVFSLPSSGWTTHLGCVGVSHDHNVWYKQGSARDNTYDWPIGTGEVWASPGWVGGSDLHLSSTASPAYNAGTTPYYSTDFDGTTIPQFTTPDIGAYEFH